MSPPMSVWQSTTGPGTYSITPCGACSRSSCVNTSFGRGSTNRKIAGALVLSEGTVQQHVVRIYRKIGVNRRAEAAAYAIRHQIA